MAKCSAATSCGDGRGVFAKFVVDDLDGLVGGHAYDFGEGLDGECLDQFLLTVVMVAFVGSPVGLPVGAGCWVKK